MSEADRAGFPFEVLCQQVSAFTQAVQRLQDSYFQIEGRLQHLTTAPGLLDTTSASASGTSSQQGQPNPAPAVVMTFPETRVPTPERFSGNRKKFRAFKKCLPVIPSPPIQDISVRNCESGIRHLLAV